MASLPSLDIAAEHGTVLRHWASVQSRVTRQMCEQARHCERLEAELMQLRARWVLATTSMLWGLGWPGAARAAAADAQRAATSHEAVTSAAELICQVGCVSHAHHWRSEAGECRLTGGDCSRVPPEPARAASAED